MKKIFRKITGIFTIFVLLVAVNMVFAQTPKRIELAKGENSATIRATGKQFYVFHADTDKTIKIRLVSKGNRATFDLFDAENSDLSEGTDGRTLEMQIGTVGEYRLNISADKRTAFTLFISIK